ncbi:MAG: TIGR00730 family Rossman fold protein, partial [Ignavibacteria bacterium]|nr:TIGR00730 family Rossman fold protein [Ignavibacteria bacterium]
EVANACLQNSGKVIGVIPEFLSQKELLHDGLTEIIITRSMHERKAMMSELSEGFIAMSGGIGTLEEFFEAWTWAQLGIHNKPIGILNVDGYYDRLIDFINNSVEQEFVNRNNLDMIVIDKDAKNLIGKMKDFKPVKVRKWMETVNS